jgi:2,3-bisphosphoglycerate-independent phosphoglycerate mutase
VAARAEVAAIRHRLLLVFADGVGLGAEVDENPFVGAAPELAALLGGPMTRERVQHGEGLVLEPLDAVLGVPGLPQSGTGQTTLFTGVNAQERLGRHVPALPGPRLRALIAEHSVMRALALAGEPVTFANAYTADYVERIERGEVKTSATTCAVLAAGVRFRLLDDLEEGRAVTWDITGEAFAQRAGIAAPLRSPREAGAALATLAGDHRLTLYETFLTDLAGHARWEVTPAAAVERLDGLLAGVFATRPADVTVLLTSDHGNVEEPWHRRHTTNPVPLLAVGPAAGAFAGLERLDQVAPRMLEVLLTREPPPGAPV